MSRPSFYRPKLFLACALVLGVGCAKDPAGLNIGPPSAVLIVSGDTQSGPAGAELPAAVVVQVTDDDGDPIEGQLVNFRIVEGGGSVFAGTALTNENGEARERWTLGTVAGANQRLEARAVDPATGAAIVFATFSATAVAGPGATLSIVEGNSQRVEAGTIAADSLAVRVADSHGNPVANATVNWTLGAGAGSVSPTSSTTGAQGIARTRWTAGSTAGAQTVSATVVGMTGSPEAVFTETVTITPASLSHRSGNTQSATVTTAVATAPSVTVKDANGNPCCAGEAVMFEVQSGGGEIIGSNLVIVDAAGVATLEGWKLGRFPGPNSLTARLHALEPVLFTATALMPEIAFITQPSSTQQFDTIAPPVRVQVSDAAGNGMMTEIRLADYTNGNFTNSVRGTLAATTVDGVATFSDLSGNAVADGHTLVATATSFAANQDDLDRKAGVADTSATFNIVARTHDVWVMKTAMPQDRHDFQAAVVNGILYAFAGPSESTPAFSRRVLAYDPATDTWTMKASSSSRLRDAVAAADDLIYSTDGALLDSYDPATDSWAAKAPLPTQVYRPAIGVANGIVYVEGATTSTVGAPVILQAYDPATNAWVAKAAPPVAITGHAVGLNGKLYLVDATEKTGTLLAYDPVTDSWTAKTSMLTRRRNFALAAMNGLLYAVGGTDDYVDPAAPHRARALGTNESFNSASNTWTARRSSSIARLALALAGANGAVYAIGGQRPSIGIYSPTAINEAYVP